MFSTLSKVWNDVSEEGRSDTKTTNTKERFQPTRSSTSKLPTRPRFKTTRFADMADIKYNEPERYRSSNFKGLKSDRTTWKRDVDTSLKKTTVPKLMDRPLKVTKISTNNRTKASSWGFFNNLGNIFSRNRELDEMKSYLNNMMSTSSTQSLFEQTSKTEDNNSSINIKEANKRTYSMLPDVFLEPVPSRRETTPLVEEPRHWKKRKLNERLSAEPILLDLPPKSTSQHLYSDMKPLPEYRPIRPVETVISKEDFNKEMFPKRQSTSQPQTSSVYSRPLTSTKSSEIEDLETFRLMYEKLHNAINGLMEELKIVKDQNAAQLNKLKSDIRSMEVNHQSKIEEIKNEMKEFEHKLREKNSSDVLSNTTKSHVQLRAKERTFSTTPPRSSRVRTGTLQQKEPNEDENKEPRRSVVDEDEFDVSLSPAKTDISQYVSKI